MSRAAASSTGGEVDLARAMRRYLRVSELPLTNLLFVLPLIIFYEIGTLIFAVDPVHHTEKRILAFDMMRTFFRTFGATARYLPAMAVIGCLLGSHIMRKDKWKLEFGTAFTMLGEGIVWALPLIPLGDVLRFCVPLARPQDDGLACRIVLSVGAGVYEELVFRLIAFLLLSLILVDLMRIDRKWSHLLIVFGMAILFSLYHYVGVEPFRWYTFVFRTAAGLYFGAVFLYRGFGVTVGAHIAYDIAASLRNWQFP